MTYIDYVKSVTEQYMCEIDLAKKIIESFEMNGIKMPITDTEEEKE